MLLLKESKINRVIILFGVCIFSLVFLSPYFTRGNVYKSLAFFEIIIPMIITIFSINFIFNNGDLKILYVGHKSYFNLIFIKYISIISSAFFLSIILFVLISTIYGIEKAYIFLMALLPVSLFTTSLAILIIISAKSFGAGLSISLFIVVIQIQLGTQLVHKGIPRYYYEFICIYDTTYMLGSDLWLINRMIILVASIACWIYIFILLKCRKENL